MDALEIFLAQHPIVPYIRECDFAVRKPWNSPIRRLLDYLLIYIQKGECLFRVDGETYRFEQGEFCLIQPNSLNELMGMSETVTPFAHFDIFYQPNREQRFPTRAGQVDLSPYKELMQPRLDQVLQQKVPVKLKLTQPLKFRDIFLTVVEHWQEGDTLSRLKAQHGMTQLMIMLLEQMLPQPSSQRTKPQTLNWITSYMSLHLNEPIRIADMAARAHVSVSRFHELFKQQYGSTPHQYLLEMRIRHACELLKQGELSHEQIAAYCGFADVHHFSKAFKKQVGMPPGHYRDKA